MALPTRQQMEDFAFATWESTKAGTGALAEAGMFKLDNVVAFTKDLGRPVNKKYITAEGFQEIVLAKMPELHEGYITMNAVCFLLEVLGSLTVLLLGGSVWTFGFSILYAFCVAYVLYWLVCLAEGAEYQIVAIFLYVVYAIMNTIQLMASLSLILPPLFFFAKLLASLCAAYYAFKIEKVGMTPNGTYATLKEKEDDGELGVAE